MRTSNALRQRRKSTFKQYLNQGSVIYEIEQNPDRIPPPHQIKPIPFKRKRSLIFVVHVCFSQKRMRIESE